MSNELYHYGVLGMKWGVRKSLATHEDYTKAHSKKKVSEMSNSELRARNNRLNMEQQYRDLKRNANVGRRAVKGFIAGAATITASVAAYKVYEKYGKKIAGKAIDKIGDLVIKDIKF